MLAGMLQLRTLPGALAAAWLGLGVAACAFKGPSPRDTPSSEAAPAQVWRAQPVRMRVYPSSRFLREDDVSLLEARVEFTDENGDTTKAVGQFRFDLYAATRAAQPRVGARLYGWTVPVYTRQENLMFYDPITRAYLFRLKLDSLSVVGEASLLRVVFIPATGGSRLEAEALIGREAGVLDAGHLRLP